MFSKSVPCKKCRPRFEELSETLDLVQGEKDKGERASRQAVEALQHQIEHERTLQKTEMFEAMSAKERERTKALEGVELGWKNRYSMLEEQMLEKKKETEAKERERVEEREKFEKRLEEQGKEHGEEVLKLRGEIEAERKKAKGEKGALTFQKAVQEARGRKQFEEQSLEVGELKSQLANKVKSIDYKNRESMEKEREIEKLKKLVRELQEQVGRKEIALATQKTHLESEMAQQKLQFQTQIEELQRQWYQSEYGHRQAVDLKDRNSFAYLRNVSENDLLEVKLKELNRENQIHLTNNYMSSPQKEKPINGHQIILPHMSNMSNIKNNSNLQVPEASSNIRTNEQHPHDVHLEGPQQHQISPMKDRGMVGAHDRSGLTTSSAILTNSASSILKNNSLSSPNKPTTSTYTNRNVNSTACSPNKAPSSQHSSPNKPLNNLNNSTSPNKSLNVCTQAASRITEDWSFTGTGGDNSSDLSTNYSSNNSTTELTTAFKNSFTMNELTNKVSKHLQKKSLGGGSSGYGSEQNFLETRKSKNKLKTLLK